MERYQEGIYLASRSIGVIVVALLGIITILHLAIWDSFQMHYKETAVFLCLALIFFVIGIVVEED